MRFYLPLVWFGCGATFALFTRAADAPAATSAPDVQLKLENLAASLTHFATLDIIRNREPDPRMPAALVAEQKQLPSTLNSLSGEHDALLALLVHPNPKVRTLALGALFEREDPKDLPAIASLIGDSAPTLPLLHMAATSQGGELPLADFEEPQTVGQVAKEMVCFYLAAAKIDVPSLRKDPFVLTLVDSSKLTGAFKDYWTLRANRDHCASWYLVKFERATRDSDPVLIENRTDTNRVLAEMRLLPSAERAWTELYVLTGTFSSTAFASDNSIQPLTDEGDRVAALKAVGPEAILHFLQRVKVTDDPDLLFDDNAIRNVYRKDQFLAMAQFILQHAPSLLRTDDTNAVTALAEAPPEKQQGDSALWLAAGAALMAEHNPTQAAAMLKTDLKKYPFTSSTAGGQQAKLMAELWRSRGSAENDTLVAWFYEAAVHTYGENDPSNGPVNFLREIALSPRPDTRELITALVNSPHFQLTDWAILKELLSLAATVQGGALVDQRTIYAYQPNSRRPDEATALASWRNLLQKNFGKGE